jgi:DNA-binding IclR family transcriptional regulator
MDEASRQPEGLRFSDVQKLLGQVSPTTVNKILKELTAAGALRKARDGRYVMGMKVYFWGRTVAARQGPMQVVRECMAELHERFKASVNLFTCSGEHMPLQLPVIGSIFFFTQEQLADEDFMQAECERHDPGMDPGKVLEMVRSARATAVQFDAGLFYPGVYRLAVPIVEQGRIAMVLGLGVLEAGGASKDVVERISAAMIEMKGRVERVMNM